jgi:hypothetical protein
MIKNAIERLNYVENEHEKLRNGEACLLMANKDNDADKSKSWNPNNGIPFRVALLEKAVMDLEGFTDSLRLGQTQREEQVRQLKEADKAQDCDIKDLQKSVLSTQATAAALKTEIFSKIDDLKYAFERKVMTLSSTNSKWFIAILTTVLTTFVVIILTRWITP